MKIHELVEKFMVLRVTQRNYFATKSRNVLRHSNALEKEFDGMVERLMKSESFIAASEEFGDIPQLEQRRLFK